MGSTGKPFERRQLSEYGDGERPSSVVASYGFNRTTIYRWLSAAATPGVGLRGAALQADERVGRVV